MLFKLYHKAKRIRNRKQLARLGIKPGRHNRFLVDGFAYLKHLLGSGAQIQSVGSTYVIVTGGIKNIVETKNDLFILDEIHHQGVYLFWLPENCVVVDIGMHVGFASLFFAKMAHVQKVYGYEPFYQTYQQAERNFNNNEEHKEKIVPHHFGLSSEDGTTEFAYNYHFKGDAGKYGLSDPAMFAPGTTKETVTLRSVKDELRKIRVNHPSEKIVLKIDCEGCEYQIIQSLCEDHAINDIALIMLEWHEKGLSGLDTTLHQQGFQTIIKFPHALNNGMIYAFKSS